MTKAKQADTDAYVQSVAERREYLERAEPTMYYFRYEHLPKALQAVSIPFWSLAADMVRTLPGCTQRTLAIQKLLESKDAAVRAALKRC